MSNPLGRRGLAYTASLGVGVAHRMLIGSGGGGGNLSTGEELAYSLICVVLIISSGVAAGLTLGLLSIDRVDLEVIKRTGTQKQKWMASKVEPLIADPHWLLVSLLLLNSASYEALPLFLDRLINPWAAIVISVSLILVFGEIAPQAVCKRYGLQIGAYSSWFVRILMWITAPISWPLGKLLDWLLGEETALFRRAELRELVALHGEPDQDGGESMLTAEEVNVIHGAMDMAHKTAETAMTPIANVFAVDANATLDRPLLEQVIAEGHSRVPVYEGHVKNIIGLILVKELVLVDVAKNLRVRECLLRDVDFILASTPLYSVIELFRLKRRHMAVLTAGTEGSEHSIKPAVATEGGDGDGDAEGNGEALLLAHGGAKETAHRAHPSDQIHEVDVVGVITFEDCLEELFGMEILDESDLFVDNERTERVPEAPHLPDKLLRYLSSDRKRKGPSTRPSSPSKQTKQDAIVAAAASAAYAAVKKVEAKAGTEGITRRVKSAGVLHDHLAATSRPPGSVAIELALQEQPDDKPVRSASMLP